MLIRVSIPELESPMDSKFRILDKVKYDAESGILDMFVTEGEYNNLLSSGYAVKVLSEDYQRDFAYRLKR